MLMYALIIFAIAALGGLLMAGKIFMGQMAPWPVSIIHALLGATGLVLLVLAILSAETPLSVTGALAVLLVAALGGFYLAFIHTKQKLASKGIVIVHAGVAVVGVLVLASAVFAIV